MAPALPRTRSIPPGPEGDATTRGLLPARDGRGPSAVSAGRGASPSRGRSRHAPSGPAACRSHDPQRPGAPGAATAVAVPDALLAMLPRPIPPQPPGRAPAPGAAAGPGSLPASPGSRSSPLPPLRASGGGLLPVASQKSSAPSFGENPQTPVQ